MRAIVEGDKPLSDAPMVVEAIECALTMEEWRSKHWPIKDNELGKPFVAMDIDRPLPDKLHAGQIWENASTRRHIYCVSLGEKRKLEIHYAEWIKRNVASDWGDPIGRHTTAPIFQEWVKNGNTTFMGISAIPPILTARM
jgi:hypothetical protein